LGTIVGPHAGAHLAEKKATFRRNDMGPINNLWDNAGTPLDQQRFTWRDMVGNPISKLDDDAFTRVRIILLNGLELDALRLKHIAARFNDELRVPLAKLRRV